MRRKAFVVGSNGPASLGRLSRLRYARSDADKMAKVLKADNVGFDVIQPSGISGTEIMDDFDRLASSVEFGDVLVFYFSGHGLLKRGRFYLALDETDWERIVTTSLPYVNVRDILRSARADHKVVILDCCHAGEALTNETGVQLRSGVDQELVRRETLPSTGSATAGSVLVACGPDGAAREADEFEGGIMTALIARALSTDLSKVADDDGYISTEGLRNWLWNRANELRTRPRNPLLVERPLLETTGYGRTLLTCTPIERSRPPHRAVKATPHNPDTEWIEKIRSQTDKVESAYRENQQLTYARLQSLAKPFGIYGKRINSFEIVDELLSREGDVSHVSAGVFAASVVVYSERKLPYLDPLLRVIGREEKIRGSSIWRALRAIKRLLAEVELSQDARDRLIMGLRLCARLYDSPSGERFQTNDVLRLIRDISVHRKVKADLAGDGILDAEQLLEMNLWWQHKKSLKQRKATDTDPNITLSRLTGMTNDILGNLTQLTTSTLTGSRKKRPNGGQSS